MSDRSLGLISIHIKNRKFGFTTPPWYLTPAVTAFSLIFIDYRSSQPCMDWKSIERFCLMLTAEQILTTRPDN
jgi:hypothetical protein